MKVSLALLSTVLFGTLSGHPALAQSFPSCLSSLSDSDGDGYGWENNSTCLVEASTSISETGQCEDVGSYPWGWNPIARISCRLDEVADLNLGTSPLVAEMLDTWICKDMVLTSGFYEPGVSRSGPLANTTVSWSVSGISRSAGGYYPDATQPEYCHYYSGTQYPQISRLTLKAIGEATREGSLAFLNTGQDCVPSSRTSFYNSELGSWSVKDYRVNVLGESFKSIEFQTVTYEGADYDLMHLNRTDYSRLSCRRGESLTGLFNLPEWN